MFQEILLYLFKEQEYFCQAVTVEINFMYLNYLNLELEFGVQINVPLTMYSS